METMSHSATPEAKNRANQRCFTFWFYHRAFDR
ncbi:hypothetical protein V6Z11_D04G115400 [Gossypium hirsutum]